MRLPQPLIADLIGSSISVAVVILTNPDKLAGIIATMVLFWIALVIVQMVAFMRAMHQGDIVWAQTDGARVYSIAPKAHPSFLAWRFARLFLSVNEPARP